MGAGRGRGMTEEGVGGGGWVGGGEGKEGDQGGKRRKSDTARPRPGHKERNKARLGW